MDFLVSPLASDPLHWIFPKCSAHKQNISLYSLHPALSILFLCLITLCPFAGFHLLYSILSLSWSLAHESKHWVCNCFLLPSVFVVFALTIANCASDVPDQQLLSKVERRKKSNRHVTHTQHKNLIIQLRCQNSLATCNVHTVIEGRHVNIWRTSEEQCWTVQFKSKLNYAD